jgi:hypothetical protein
MTISIQLPDTNLALKPTSKGLGAAIMRLLGASYEFTNGDRYQGSMSKDLPNGKGKYLFKNGDSIEGLFENGVLKSEVNYTYANGAKYKGQVENGVAHGQGAYSFKNQMTLIGQFEDGNPVGNIKITQSYERKGYYLCKFDSEGNFEGTFVSKTGATSKGKFTGKFTNGTLTLQGNMKRGIG